MYYDVLFMSNFIQQFEHDSSGIRVSIKDCIDMQGVVTSMGSRAFSYAAPAVEDARIVEKLMSSGCSIIGKTNMHELAFGMTGVNAYAGTPTNPIFPNYIPGGSSSGAAASVASQSVDFAVGTDTGGSVRLPAACCGVYGLKTTYGRLSRDGIWPTQSSLDCVGIFAHQAEMLGKAMTILDDGFDESGLPDELLLANIDVQATPQITQAISQFVNRLGCKSIQVSLPCLDDAFHAGMTIISIEAWGAWGHLTGQSILGEDVEDRLLQAANITSDEVNDALEVKQLFTEQVNEMFNRCDLLVLPTLPNFPLTLDEALMGKQDLSASRFVRPFNLSGHPALSIPIKCEYGPVALQVVAPMGKDELLCQFATAVQSKLQLNEETSIRGGHQ